MADDEMFGGDLDIPSSVDDSEYAESIWNDENDVKEHDVDDIPEEEDIAEGVDSLEELRKKKKEKDRKKATSLFEEEEVSFAYNDNEVNFQPVHNTYINYEELDNQNFLDLKQDFNENSFDSSNEMDHQSINDVLIGSDEIDNKNYLNEEQRGINDYDTETYIIPTVEEARENIVNLFEDTEAKPIVSPYITSEEVIFDDFEEVNPICVETREEKEANISEKNVVSTLFAEEPASNDNYSSSQENYLFTENLTPDIDATNLNDSKNVDIKYNSAISEAISVIETDMASLEESKAEQLSIIAEKTGITNVEELLNRYSDENIALNNDERISENIQNIQSINARIEEENKVLDTFYNNTPASSTESISALNSIQQEMIIAPFEEKVNVAQRMLEVETSCVQLTHNAEIARENADAYAIKYADTHNISIEEAHTVLSSNSELPEAQKYKEALSNAESYSHYAEEIQTTGKISEEAKNTINSSEFAAYGSTVSEKANVNRDVAHDTRVEGANVDDTSKELEDTSKASYVEKQKNLHEFERVGGHISAGVESAGHSVIGMADNAVATSDLNYSQGNRAMRKVTDTVRETVELASIISGVIGANDTLTNDSRGAFNASKAINSGIISKSDLQLTDAELKEKLSETMSLGDARRLINSFGDRESVSGLLNVQSEISSKIYDQKEALENQLSSIKGRLGESISNDEKLKLEKRAGNLEKQIKALNKDYSNVNSNKFFDLADKKNIGYYNTYFKNSDNDVLSNTVGKSGVTNFGNKRVSWKDNENYKKLEKAISKQDILEASKNKISDKRNDLINKLSNPDISKVEKEAISKKIDSLDNKRLRLDKAEKSALLKGKSVIASKDEKIALLLGKDISGLSNARKQAGNKIRNVRDLSIRKVVRRVVTSDENANVGYGLASQTLGTIRKAKKTVTITGEALSIMSKPVRKLAVKIIIGTKRGGYKGILTQLGRLTLNQLKSMDLSLYMMTKGKFSVTSTITKARELAKSGFAYLGKDKAFVNGKIADGRMALRKLRKKGQDALKNAAKSGLKKLASTKAGISVTGRANAVKKAYKQAAANARRLANKAMQTRAARIAARAIKTTGKVGKVVGRVLSKPFVAVAKVFGGFAKFMAQLFKIFGAVTHYVLIGVVILIVLYVINMVVVSALFQLLGTGTASGGTTIVFEPMTFVSDEIQRSLDKWMGRKDAAKKIGEGTPINPAVWDGHEISAYGTPVSDNENLRTETDDFGHLTIPVNEDNWLYGYKIFYVDDEFDVRNSDYESHIITSGKNNVKDALILSYVESGGEWAIDGENPAGTTAQKSTDNWWNYLNPTYTKGNGSPLEKYYKESDIYACPTGCETIYYRCNDDATMDNEGHEYMMAADIPAQDVATGMHIHCYNDNIIRNSCGDYYITTCKGHDHGTATTTAYAPSGCNNHTGATYSGTTWTVSCKGHKTLTCTNKSKKHVHTDACYTTTYCGDTSGTINTPSGCDAYSISVNGMTITATCNKTGGCTHYHACGKGTDPNNINAPSSVHDGVTYTCDNYDTEWFCTGHQATACFGHKDVSIYIPTRYMEDVLDANSTVKKNESALRNLKEWDYEAKDWCNSLYGENWYEKYGIDPVGGYGFSNDYVMSPAKIDEVMKLIESQYPKLSEVRKSIIRNGLGAVGHIPYYMGGKAYSINPGQAFAYPQGNGNKFALLGPFGEETGIVDLETTKRSLSGLDCSGFVGYIYWLTYDENVLEGASGCGPTCVTISTMYHNSGTGKLVHISSQELKPGDIGLMAPSQHIGIFAGYDNMGHKMWIHCTGGPTNCVVYGPCSGFDVYARYIGMKD